MALGTSNAAFSRVRGTTTIRELTTKIATVEDPELAPDPINFKEIDAPERDDACTVDKTDNMKKADNQGACRAVASRACSGTVIPPP